MKQLLLCVVTVALAVGCSSGPANQSEQPAEGFALVQHDATTLEATYTSGGATVRALAVETSSNVVEVTYDFGETVIGFHIDYNQGVGSFIPSGTLDAAQARLIEPLLVGITESVSAEKRTRVEEAAMRQTSFMQIVPVGEALSPYEYVSERGWVHITCGCAYKYIGSGYYRTAGAGCGCTGGSGNGCKGRCGQGCGLSSTPPCVGTTAYTQDCAKHDYGLGSFSAASDDYSFASNNCSCSSGSCY